MSKFTDAFEDVMISRIQGQTPQLQLMQTYVADEVRATKARAKEELKDIKEQWKQDVADMQRRGVTTADVEWIQAYQDYREDLREAKEFVKSLKEAGTRILNKVGRN